MRSPGRPSTSRREDRVRFWRRSPGADERGRGGSGRRVAGRWRRGGSGRLAGCRRSRWPRCRGATCRSLSGRRSRCCAPKRQGCARSPAGWVARRRRSRGSCAATHRLAVTRLEYRASIAQWQAERRAQRPKVAKLAANKRLREYVQDRLAGGITTPDGSWSPGREVRWIGRRQATGQIAAGRRAWSPEQIASRLRIDFPDDESHADLARGDLPGALRPGPRRAQAGAGRVPAHRPGAARPPRPDPRARQEVHVTARS